MRLPFYKLQKYSLIIVSMDFWYQHTEFLPKGFVGQINYKSLQVSHGFSSAGI